MEYVLATLIGLVCGAVAMFVIVDAKRRKLDEKEEALRVEKLETQSISQRLQAARGELNARQAALDASIAQFTQASADFSSRAVAYDELWNENAVLKRDLRNLHLHVNKMVFDNDAISQKQASLVDRINDLGSRYLKENVAWIGSSINASNYGLSKKRLLAVIERCRKIDFDVSAEQETELMADLKTEFEKAVRAALEREEQARIKAQIREEQQRAKEVDREMKQLDREREAIESALERALREATDEHSEEIERLKARLAEAEERKQRAISQAQITKSGHVYVISNIGSFGEGVFKIGMTRRLEPMDRVKELGDASVPFPFDVHMMISANDAPKLENALHHAFHTTRLNKTNPRKEFFRASVEEICNIVREHHGEVDYVADAEALQYRQSLEMTDEDLEFIESVYGDGNGDDDDTYTED